MSLIKGTGAGDQPSTGFFSHTLDQSLRFNDNDSASLTRTPGSASNQRTWTWSAWVKRSTLGNNYFTMFSAKDSSLGNYLWIQFTSSADDQINIYNYPASDSFELTTNPLFRDTNGWYHIVVAVDTTNGTAGNRVKLYVNGERVTSFATESYPAEDYQTAVNRANLHSIGSYDNGSYYFDGYMAEVHLLDGIANDPTTLGLGETKDGVWVPKAYSGSHGTNGFYLPFDDSSAIGDDESANTNDFTANNLAATDVVLDSPTNNFATLNPLYASASQAVLFEGNLKAATAGFSSAAYGYGAISTFDIPKDKKIYIEVEDTGAAGDNWFAGFATKTSIEAGPAGNTGGSGAITVYNRSVKVNGTETDYGSSAGLGGLSVAKLAAGDILGCAIDGATGKVWFSRNGTYFKSPSTNDSGTTGNPSAGSNEIGTITGGTTDDVFFVLGGGTSADNIFVNFGQDSVNIASAASGGGGIGTFEYAPPTDYLALCTSNMSDITIGPGQDEQASDNFNTVIWTGNNANNRAIAVGFQPDFSWTQTRTQYANGSELFDSVRGAGKTLKTDSLAAEVTNKSSGYIGAFTSTGFTTADGSSSNSSINYNDGGGQSYVAWNWKGGGSASTNTDGSGIDSSVSANVDAGFSVLTYTGTGNTSHTIGHGLGKTPAFVMSKSRDTGSGGGSYWFIKWNGQTSNNNLLLNFTDAQTNIATNYAGGGWSDFDSSNTTTIVPRIGYTGSSVDSVNKSGEDYVAWVWAEIEGYSAIGSFKGNGADDGPFVYTGFRPAWLWIKRLDAANDWHIMDDVRNPTNPMDGLLFANLANNESSDAAYNRDFVSNGFKIRGSEPYVNASGGTFVYMAFARSPFKFGTAF